MSRKQVIIGILLTIAVLVAFGEFYILSYGQSLRRSGIFIARSVLKQTFSQRDFDYATCA